MIVSIFSFFLTLSKPNKATEEFFRILREKRHLEQDMWLMNEVRDCEWWINYVWLCLPLKRLQDHQSTREEMTN